MCSHFHSITVRIFVRFSSNTADFLAVFAKNRRKNRIFKIEAVPALLTRSSADAEKPVQRVSDTDEASKIL